nr:MAG TPA: hypothetical protein [Caudoviricetes sp.]
MERRVLTMEEIYMGDLSEVKVERPRPQPKLEPKTKTPRVYPSLNDVKEEVMKELREITRGGDLEGIFEDEEDEEFEIEYAEVDEVFEDEDEITSNADSDCFNEILERHLGELDFDAANASEVYEGYVKEMEGLGLNYLSEDEFMEIVQTDFK